MSRNAMNQCIEDVNRAEEQRETHRREWLASIGESSMSQAAYEQLREAEWEADQRKQQEAERLAALAAKWPGVLAWPGKESKGSVATLNGDIFPGD